MCVFAPAPLLTVTIESKPDGSREDEVHLHAGGQGFWISRLIAELGVDVVLCGSFGGESGRVARALIEDERVAVHGIAAAGSNGTYVHDRRSGKRIELATMASDPLTRHELDELYGIVLLEGLESDVTVLGGPTGPPIVPPSTYRRLAGDLRANGSKVVADLSGDPLAEVLSGGVDVLKISEEELRDEHRISSDDPAAVVEAMRTLAGEGAKHVVTTRATLARGGDLFTGLRLGAAAGALNVTRRGLATGQRSEIERLASYVEVETLDGPSPRLAAANAGYQSGQTLEEDPS